jgi:glycosyltransferase involved in cell wall biosynthesis
LKYSIIIPTLNEEKLLSGILKQLTNPELTDNFDFELIVSDGGSIDNTLRIALDYADTIVVHTESNYQSIASGRNEGAKLANGDILFFFNGDIRIEDPLKLFNFVRDKFENSSYLAMTGYVSVFTEEEEIPDKVFHFLYNHYFQLLNNIGVGMGRGECHIVRKEIFEELGGYNEELFAGEDFDLFRRIRNKGKILYSGKIRVYESPRRFHKKGYFTVTWMWTRNGLSVWLRNKSISKIWEQVR